MLQFNCCTVSLWHREAASKKSVRDITRISCFVTTMKLRHALQIYSTVSVKKCMWLHFQSSAATNYSWSGKFNYLFVGRQLLSATVKELYKLDSICESYAQVKKGPVLSASLYVSKRGDYWDRLCRDVVGWLVVGCHAHALWPNGAS